MFFLVFGGFVLAKEGSPASWVQVDGQPDATVATADDSLSHIPRQPQQPQRFVQVLARSQMLWALGIMAVIACPGVLLRLCFSFFGGFT